MNRITLFFFRLYLKLTGKPMPFAGQRWYWRIGKVNDPKAYAVIVEPIFSRAWDCYCKKYYLYPGGKTMHAKNEFISILDIVGTYKFVKDETVVFKVKKKRSPMGIISSNYKGQVTCKAVKF